MLNEDRRKVIHALYTEGKKKKEIARLLNLTPKTVRKILKAAPGDERGQRSDKKIIDVEHLRALYARCNGYVRRIYEILREEESANIGYSTLTHIIRENGIGQKIEKRCHQVPDTPGTEMQHDTSTYKIKLGADTRIVICSGLYLRYSKMRYIKFYFHFNRFKMKCFFHEALRYWGYASKSCVIDNTNLAVLHGTGAGAIIHPEMAAFSKPYGFSWMAHEKGHSNRKAGKERDFWTVETNFLPGRSFESLEDLNLQAFDWAVKRCALRPQSVTHLIPVELFEKEKPDLIKLPGYIEPPYQAHKRNIDQYGYIAFNANYYWVPGKATGEVSVLEYSDRIKIYPEGLPPIEYLLAESEVRNRKYVPEGASINPYEPSNIKKPSHEEEKLLRAMGENCSAYLDLIQASPVKQKPKFIRGLYGFSKKLAPALFEAAIVRALKYHVLNLDALTRISRQLMGKGFSEVPETAITSDYENRGAYQEGRFSHETELKYYQNLLDENKNDEE